MVDAALRSVGLAETVHLPLLPGVEDLGQCWQHAHHLDRTCLEISTTLYRSET